MDTDASPPSAAFSRATLETEAAAIDSWLADLLSRIPVHVVTVTLASKALRE
jgi:hypothetical protein